MKFGMKGSDKQKIIKFEQVKAVSEGKKVISNLHSIIHVDPKLIIGIDRTLDNRSENKAELCFECGNRLDECCKNNVIQDSKKTTIYGYLCCSCKSENEALDDDLANDLQ